MNQDMQGSAELRNMDTQIAREHRDMFLDMLCQHLDIGVSIMDENLTYKFISDSAYAQLGICPEDMKVGDSLSRCHELMVKNGMMTPGIMKKNNLSTEEQITRIKNNKSDKRRLVKLGNGTTQSFVRKVLPNKFVMSISEDVSALIDKDIMLEKSLAIGRAGYWIYDFKRKNYTLSKSLRSFLPPSVVDNIEKFGILAAVDAEYKQEFKVALKNIHKTNDVMNVIGRSFNKDGQRVWARTRAELIRDPKGRPLQIWAFVQDVTKAKQQSLDLERAKDNAIAASKAKSEFLANMSHEIRTPMNGILGMAELLANSDIDGRQRDFVNVINNSASALLAIINDILDFSKIEAGALEMDPMPFNLKSAINDVTSLLVTKAQEKGIELIINYPSHLQKRFIGDGGRLRQVLTNLVGNAIKFTEEGHITVTVDISEEKEGRSIVSLDVEDTGIGIPENKLKHIFDKFTQADGSTTRVYGGTGLGLAITKSIVEMMDGRISLSSEVGKGSIFSILIPLPVDKKAVTRKLDSSQIKGKRALIIDDIDINRQLFSEQLENWNVKSDCAADGIEGLAALKSQQESGKPYDFVILDYLMPGLNGQEWAQMVTANKTLACPPIIMLSSCDQPASTPELQEIGIVDFHLKPVREKRLHEAITNAINTSPIQDNTSPADVPAQAESLAAESAKHSLKTQELVENALETIRPKQITPEDKSQNVEATKPDLAKSQLKAPTAPRVPKSNKIPILVAEDFPLNQDVVRLMLADSIFEPHFANNGKEAVETYTQDPNKYPVILMDVSMPVMDGYEASGLIRDYERENELDHTPIVALTGHALKNDKQACLDAGMDDFLTKPVKQSELFDRLSYHAEVDQAVAV